MKQEPGHGSCTVGRVNRSADKSGGVRNREDDRPAVPAGNKKEIPAAFCPLAGAAAGYIDSVAVVALRCLEEPAMVS